MAKTVILTRPLKDSLQLADILKKKGFAPVVAPLLEIVPQSCASSYATSADALLVTSANAMHALTDVPPQWLEKPVFAVGEATAAALRDRGFTQIIAGDSTAEDVIHRIPEFFTESGGRTVLFLSGQHISTDPQLLLAPYGITVGRSVTYVAEAVSALPDALLQHLKTGTPATLLFYSTRTAAIFRALIMQHALTATLGPLTALCFSPAIAETLADLPWAACDAVQTPTTEAILSALGC